MSFMTYCLIIISPLFILSASFRVFFRLAYSVAVKEPLKYTHTH